jgi:pantoate--beta-alanine ligase
MIIFKKADQLSAHLLNEKKSGKSTGFVPTMGALHDGHLSLVKKSQEQNQITVCSIFINPTQFNNAEDFRLYPVTIETDIEMLVNAGCDLLFLPALEEVYPPDHRKKHYELGPVEQIWEGEFRPGHFQGVCEVVDRLLDIIQPDQLYMGQKDFQQCMVIRKLLLLTGRTEKVKLQIAPTLREKDGLAMSSRNRRLLPEQRQHATMIYQALLFIREKLPDHEAEWVRSRAREMLENAGFSVDYIAIARAHDLSQVAENEAEVVLVAASIGNIRLIDNLSLN